MLKSVRAAHATKRSWKQGLNQFSRMYRCTEHCTTGSTPYQLMFNREPKTKLPAIGKKSELYEKVNQYDVQKKLTMKSYYDKRNNAKRVELNVDDHVYMRQRKVNKWSTPYNTTIYTVIRKNNNMLTVKDGNNNFYTRNISVFQKSLYNYHAYQYST